MCMQMNVPTKNHSNVFNSTNTSGAVQIAVLRSSADALPSVAMRLSSIPCSNCIFSIPVTHITNAQVALYGCRTLANTAS